MVEIPPNLVNKAIASKFFQKYVLLAKDLPSRETKLSEITQEIITAIQDYFSVEFSLEVKTYYDSLKYLECAQKERMPNPKDVIGHLEGSTYHVFIRPKNIQDQDATVFYITELIVNSLLIFLFPDWNEASITYYSLALMFDKLYKIDFKAHQREEIRKDIERTTHKKIAELSQLTAVTSLTCPFCASKEIEYLGLQNTGKVEIKGGIPVLSGKSEDVNLMAYYKCANCKRVFFAKPEKSE